MGIDVTISSAQCHPYCSSFWPPAPPSPTPGAWSRQQNENSVQYFFYLLFVRTHTKFSKKKWNWHGNRNLMISDFDLLTSTKGHQFDPRMKILLAFWFLIFAPLLTLFCLSSRPIWYATWPCLKKDPLGTPSASKSHPWDMTKVTEWKSCLICFVSFICENTHKVWYKIFEIDMVTEI